MNAAANNKESDLDQITHSTMKNVCTIELTHPTGLSYYFPSIQTISFYEKVLASLLNALAIVIVVGSNNPNNVQNFISKYIQSINNNH